jgi:DNA-binding winged helix-turn-helix (wHTH) protein
MLVCQPRRRAQLIYVFENHSLDPDRRELRRRGELVPVEPQVFDLLQHLIRNRDRVVSSADLIATVWNGRIVAGSTLGSRISAVRRAVGDTGERQRMIVTLPRRGLRFIGEVREERCEISGNGAKSPGKFDLDKEALSAPPSAQVVTFCKTTDGINLAVAAAGGGEVLVRTTHWLSHAEYDWLNR